MVTIAFLKVDTGNLQQGLSFSVQIEQNGRLIFERSQARLAPNSELQMLYETWSDKFVTLRHLRGWEIDEALPTNSSVKDDRDACLDLVRRTEASLKNWLIEGGNEHWRTVREELKSQFKIYSHEFYLVIKTNDKLLWKLPWYAWDLLEQYPDVGIGFMLPDFQAPSGGAIAHHERVRILSILGNDRGLNLSPDREAIQGLTNTEPHFLDKPSARSLIEAIRDKRGWDILFFAGHSESLGDRGRIYINERESLEVYEFKNALQAARDRGLKLAIFNSCQGLALANELASLKIPAIVVMKEAVPDRVAQRFLKEFLTEYSSGKLLQTAVRKAQEALEAEGKELPGATWLPIVCQHSGQFTPRWQDLLSTHNNGKSNQLKRILKVCVLVSLVVFALRWQGYLEFLELKAFDFFLQQQPIEIDERIAVIRITEEDNHLLQKTSNIQGLGDKSISDATLDELFKQVNELKPLVIGLNIWRPGEVDPKYSHFIKALKNTNTVVSCTKNSGTIEKSIAAPALDIVTQEQIGFDDYQRDRDGLIRRRFLMMGMKNDNSCKPNQSNQITSFSLQVAQKYLESKGILRYDRPEDEYIQLGKTRFYEIPSHFGGYQNNPTVKSGIQIILSPTPYEDYRKDIVSSYTVSQVLDNGLSESKFKDRIILISTDLPKTRAYPQSSDEITDVFLHAQTISYLLSVVQREKPILSAYSWWQDLIWIQVWGMLGGLLYWKINPRQKILVLQILFVPKRFISLVVFSIILGCISYQMLIVLGKWIPFVPALLSLFMTFLWLSIPKHYLRRLFETQ
jgi:CHASE2 domain-containing sensor protein